MVPSGIWDVYVSDQLGNTTGKDKIMATTPQPGSFRTWANRIIRATERSATQLDKMERDIEEIKETLLEIKEQMREWYTDWRESE